MLDTFSTIAKSTVQIHFHEYLFLRLNVASLRSRSPLLPLLLEGAARRSMSNHDEIVRKSSVGDTPVARRKSSAVDLAGEFTTFALPCSFYWFRAR
jgi:hypothetical protein